MIFVKYPPGALGNFLCTILINLKTNSLNMDYGINGTKDILHLYDLKSHNTIDKNKYRIISCNNDISKEFFQKYYNDNNQMVFIKLTSHFIEYRLNFIHKVPRYWSEEQNEIAIKERWKGFEHPVACDGARRIFRLYQHLEQNHVNCDERDIIFNFENFYTEDLKIWIDSLTILFDKLRLQSQDLEYWYYNFRQTQKPIIDKAKQIRDSIENNKFLYNFNEEEKGIIIGEHCYRNNINDNRAFDEIYNDFI
jgi:hypothetical protein